MILNEALILSRDSVFFSPDSVDCAASLIAPTIIRTISPIKAIEMISSRSVNPLREKSGVFLLDKLTYTSLLTTFIVFKVSDRSLTPFNQLIVMSISRSFTGRFSVRSFKASVIDTSIL